MAPKSSGYVYGRNEVVRLLVIPEGAVTWGTWGYALRGLRMFEEDWEFVGFEFEVWDQEGGEEEERVLKGVGWLWET